MKIKNALVTLLVLLMACISPVFTACDNDGPQPDEPNKPVDIPTEDVVSTMLKTKTAVFATSDGKLLSAVKRRLSNVVIVSDGVEIPEDVRLIILDEASAARFLQSTEKFSSLCQYYARGGMIYMHFPRLNQAAIVARLVYNTYNPLPGEGEISSPLFEGYLFDKHGNEKQINDIFDKNGGAIEEAGGVEGMTEYAYGQIADGVARFVDNITGSKVEKNKVRTAAQSDGINDLPFITKEYDDPGRTVVEMPVCTAYTFMVVNVTAKIRSAYSFSENKDYYQVILTESINPRSAFGITYFEGGARVDGHYNGGMDLNISLGNEANVYSLSDIMPENKSHDGETMKVEDISFKAGLEVGTANNRGGLWGGVSFEHKTITMPVRELGCELKQKNKSNFGWVYTLAGPKYKVDKKEIKHIAAPEIAGKLLITQQCWTWTVDNPLGQGDNPFKINVGLTTHTKAAYVTKKGEVGTVSVPKEHKFEIPLPVPSRVKHPLTIVHHVSKEANELREELKAISPTFADLAANKTWYAPTEDALYDAACLMWGNAFTEITRVANDKNLGIKGKSEDIKFYLHLNNRPVEIYKNSNFRSIFVSKNDTVYSESD